MCIRTRIEFFLYMKCSLDKHNTFLREPHFHYRVGLLIFELFASLNDAN